MSAKAEEPAIVGGFVSFILALGLSVFMLFYQKIVIFRCYILPFSCTLFHQPLEVKFGDRTEHWSLHGFAASHAFAEPVYPRREVKLEILSSLFYLWFLIWLFGELFVCLVLSVSYRASSYAFWIRKKANYISKFSGMMVFKDCVETLATVVLKFSFHFKYISATG